MGPGDSRPRTTLCLSRYVVRFISSAVSHPLDGAWAWFLVGAAGAEDLSGRRELEGPTPDTAVDFLGSFLVGDWSVMVLSPVVTASMLAIWRPIAVRGL